MYSRSRNSQKYSPRASGFSAPDTLTPPPGYDGSRFRRRSDGRDDSFPPNAGQATPGPIASAPSPTQVGNENPMQTSGRRQKSQDYAGQGEAEGCRKCHGNAGKAASVYGGGAPEPRKCDECMETPEYCDCCYEEDACRSCSRDRNLADSDPTCCQGEPDDLPENPGRQSHCSPKPDKRPPSPLDHILSSLEGDDLLIIVLIVLLYHENGADGSDIILMLALLLCV